MSNKLITIWLILLTAWVVWNDVERHKNLEIRRSATIIRKQKFDDIEAAFKSFEKYINGPLRDELNEMKKYLHKH